jgi:hypothetical protein
MGRQYGPGEPMAALNVLMMRGFVTGGRTQ